MNDARKQGEGETGGRGRWWCIKAGQTSVCVSHQPRDDDNCIVTLTHSFRSEISDITLSSSVFGAGATESAVNNTNTDHHS
ncbi:uncharacterized [Tachysurus ichikawai]